MFQRREVLKLTLGGAVACARPDIGFAETPLPAAAPPAKPAPSTAPSAAGPVIPRGKPVEFQQGVVADMARALAKQPFKGNAADLPEPFRSMSTEQYRDIRLKPEVRVWADQSLGFVIAPLHRGPQNNTQIEINVVEDGKAYRLGYDASLFDFGKLAPGTKVGDIGFAGFRVLKSQDDKTFTEVASFAGPNFFQALATGQVPGLLSRALALKIGDAKGEEMPIFRTLWIQKPSLVENVVVIDALLDSDSVAGAFRFTIRPGEATIIDTECTFFPRTTIDNFGLAAMSATHLLSFMDHKKFDDYRPNVSEVEGLQLLTGANEWVWRPVSNRETLQISTFVDTNPRGFGCVVRNRNFQDYDDEEQHWEKRPSLWVQPLGDWGEGGVQLIEIPSQSDANDNILSFWRPKAPLKEGIEASFAYRQFWCWDPPDQPDLARAIRSHSGSAGNKRRFFVEFRGDILADPERGQGLTQTLTATGGSITMTKTFPTSDKKGYRILFELDPAGAESSELRLQLQAQGRPVSETWLYRWTPL